MQTAIIYHYFELDETYRDNFIYFLEFGVEQTAHYFIFISGDCTVDLPQNENVKIHFIENKNGDYGALVNFNKLGIQDQYDYFVVINCSVRGPFLPTYANAVWHEYFTSILKDKTAMVGSSINVLPEDFPSSQRFKNKFNFKSPYTHVQTFAYALSNTAFCLLSDRGYFNTEEIMSKNDIILHYEIAISQELMDQGFSISSLLPTYENFTDANRCINYTSTAKSGDVGFRGAFYGRNVSPFENIFVKTNRNMISNVELASVTFTSLAALEQTKILSCEGKDLMCRTHNFALEHSNKFVITLNDLAQTLRDIKAHNPLLARQLQQLL